MIPKPLAVLMLAIGGAIVVWPERRVDLSASTVRNTTQTTLSSLPSVPGDPLGRRDAVPRVVGPVTREHVGKVRPGHMPRASLDMTQFDTEARLLDVQGHWSGCQYPRSR
jgi:hypothetical protein